MVSWVYGVVRFLTLDYRAGQCLYSHDGHIPSEGQIWGGLMSPFSLGALYARTKVWSLLSRWTPTADAESFETIGVVHL